MEKVINMISDSFKVSKLVKSLQLYEFLKYGVLVKSKVFGGVIDLDLKFLFRFLICIVILGDLVFLRFSVLFLKWE